MKTPKDDAMKKNALGRGLDALMPQIDTAGGALVDIAITRIDPNPNQPRRHFDDGSLKDLADSIREVGLLQPILVREEKGRYQIIAGERRFRAARLAGYKTLPCIVKDYTRNEQLEAALIENLQREDLNPLEEAQAVRSLMDAGRYTQETVAERLGKSRSAIANTLRLLSLPEDLQLLVRDGQITEGHARVLAGVPSLARKRELAEKIIKDGLSVRQTEKLAAETPPIVKPMPLKVPELAEFEEKMHRAFGARTQVRGGLDAGKVVISYKNRTELDAIYEAVERLLQE